jgi:hypothetical protein
MVVRNGDGDAIIGCFTLPLAISALWQSLKGGAEQCGKPAVESYEATKYHWEAKKLEPVTIHLCAEHWDEYRRIMENRE